MLSRVLILGGYGNFGSRIVQLLSNDTNIQVIINGRNKDKCSTLAQEYRTAINPPETHVADIHDHFENILNVTKPHIVIHTSGPFQEQGYDIAEACIDFGCHYLDLADGRSFVSDIAQLDEKTKAKKISVISGASSVPCLTSAIIDHYQNAFSKIDSIDYGIATAQRTNAGLATTSAILGYAGNKLITLINGEQKSIYGWQDIISHTYPELGKRFLANCDIPDLALFPKIYPDLKTIRFRAGLEVPFLHYSLWLFSFLVRFRVLKSLKPFASFFHAIAPAFNIFGSERSGFHMTMKGIDKAGMEKNVTFYLLTASGHGPFIPCIPAALCAIKLAAGKPLPFGAYACTGIISLEEYLEALKPFDIKSLEK